MKITLPVLGMALLTAVLLSILYWGWCVLHQFQIPAPWYYTLPWNLLHTFQVPPLRWIGIQSLAVGFVPVGFALNFLNEIARGDGSRVLRGAPRVSGPELANRTREKVRKGEPPVQVGIAGVPIPPACEAGHLLLAGSTGAGKSTAIDELLSGVLARGDRMIVVDPDGHALARFARKGDTVLNPFDRRSPGWNLFNEIRQPFDYPRLAKSVVPDSADSTAQQWHGYAQQLLSETMRALAQTGETSTERLLHWLIQAPAPELAQLLAGTAASGLFEPGAEKALGSTRFILSHHLSACQYLREGDFSLRTWLEKGQGNLFITWREDMRDALRPLVSAWVDILTAAILMLPTERPRALWLVLDELASLERLTSLEAGLTKGRKHGLRVVAGLQSTAQLDARYGHHAATTLRSCFRNLLALGCANSDPETTEILSKGLGQVEIEHVQTTHGRSERGGSTSASRQRHIETLVLPAELTSLPPLHGFLKLAGNYPVAKVRLTPGSYPVRSHAFVERR
jgi:hypothetical protein